VLRPAEQILCVVLLIGLAAPVVAPAQKLTATPDAIPTTLADRESALKDIFHKYWEANLERYPEFASTIGDTRYNDKVTDFSVGAENAWLAREQDWLLKLAEIDPTGLSEQEKLSQELLIRKFTQDAKGAEFKEWDMPVNQMGGIQIDYAELGGQLSFNNVKDYENWIARLHALPDAFRQVTTNMSLGVEDGRVPPKYLLQKVLDQVKQIAGEKAEDTPFAAPLKKMPVSIAAADQDRLKTELLDAVTKDVLPAYMRFARFLAVTYIPAGAEDPGISGQPDGARYYAFCIKRETTTDLTPEQIHQIGLDEVKRDEAEMLAIARKLGFKDLASFRASLKTNPKLKAASGDALLAAYAGFVRPMQAKLPDLFGTLPKAPLEVVPMPDYMAASAPPAYYVAGTPDGTVPGKLWVSTFNATDRNLYSVEAIAYHEGVPGHHLQISIAHELTGMPEFRKFDAYTAYTEGWALYAEHLGKDAGFYQDPYSDYGRLEADMWRAIRLVVDTGVHSEHWTRQQMVDYFHDHSNIDETTVQTEVDRYIAWPGQALAYKIGQMKILELRARAEKALGAKYDIKAFDDVVVDAGALPLDVLETRVNTWIAAQGGVTAPAGPAK
jgi:uncharacterized protein (DUF885 family)